MTISDVLRVLLCLGLLVCTAFLVANMRPRLHNEDSRWLAGYVFIVSMSMFLAAADYVGTDQPIKWYGTPLRLIGVAVAMVYIWKTRPGRTAK